MEAMVSHIAKSLVDNPDKVFVEISENDDLIDVVLKVAPEDMGKIIGKHGKIANALRTVLKAVGARSNKKVFVEIAD